VIEVRDVRQVEGEARRRWFTDDDFDLMVWYHADDSVHGFELSYDKPGYEKALRWFDDAGLSHHAVDTGEQNPAYNRSPMLSQSEGRSEMKRVLAGFKKSTEGLPDGLSELVQTKLAEYGRFDT
jgi:hypothetical protein